MHLLAASECTLDAKWTAPLAKGEERSCVPGLAELSCTAQCFVSTQHSTGQRRYELTEYAGARSTLGLHPDEGGKMFPMLWFLFHHFEGPAEVGTVIQGTEGRLGLDQW